MSLLNIPFEILLGILVFALPLLGRLYGRLRQRQGRQQEQNPASTRTDASPARADRPRQAEANTGTLSAPTSTATSTPTPNVPTDTARWLEEAQRRVREAQRAEDDRRSRGSVNPRTRPQTPARPQASPQNPAPTRSAQPRSQPQARPLEGRSLETRDVTPRRTEARSLETFSTEAQSLETSRGGAALTLNTAPPLTVQRLGDDRRARMVSPELRFDERELARGLIWHQILSPPLSQRRTRSSRPRP